MMICHFKLTRAAVKGCPFYLTTMANTIHNLDGSWKADDIKYMEERIQVLLEYVANSRNEVTLLKDQVAYLKTKLDENNIKY
jgi:hypothetical protein